MPSNFPATLTQVIPRKFYHTPSCDVCPVLAAQSSETNLGMWYTSASVSREERSLMTTITLEVPDDLATQLQRDPALLQALLRKVVNAKSASAPSPCFL
jgi:hypothetical protein